MAGTETSFCVCVVGLGFLLYYVILCFCYNFNGVMYVIALVIEIRICELRVLSRKEQKHIIKPFHEWKFRHYILNIYKHKGVILEVCEASLSIRCSL